jgi:putative DNA primase/helicase
MNAPFDPTSVVDEVMRQVELGSGPLILSTATPWVTAWEMIRRRYMQPGATTLHHQQGAFYEWTGTHYREAERDEMRANSYRFLHEAQRQVGDLLVPFNPTRSKVNDVLDALAAAAQIPANVRPPAWLDDKSHPDAADIMACSNGLLHLPTRALLQHTPSFFGVNAVDYRFQPDAGEPTEWLRFLESIWPEDEESIKTLQELFGLLLTADTLHQKIFLIVGPKRSGKGTVARILFALLGCANVASPTLSSLSQNFGLAPLIGKPLAIISDARLGGRSDPQVISERLLSISGEDALTVDRKNREAWTGQFPTRFLILSNELPRIADASGALASRFVVLRMTKSFYGREDLALIGKLIAELPGILNWAIEGRDRLTKRGHFLQPASAVQTVEELANLSSPIGAFVRDRCDVDEGLSIECDDLFAAWIAWCGEQHNDHPGTRQGFGRNLRAFIPGLSTNQVRHAVTKKQIRIYEGVALRS